MFAVLTGHTCGEACWHAREEVCRCSCGGANHGILVQGGARPARTCRIKGHRYELVTVGQRRELWSEYASLMRAAPPRIIAGHSFAWTEYAGSDAGAPYILKAASKDQCNKWGELSHFAGLSAQEHYHQSPALLWRKV